MKTRQARGIRTRMKSAIAFVSVFAALTITSTAAFADDTIIDLPEEGGTSVHVAANVKGVTLEREFDGEWKPICTAPCDQRVPIGQYRLGGTGLRATSPFEISNAGPTVLKGSMAPEGRKRTGMILTTIGSVLLAIATPFFIGAGAAAAGSNFGGGLIGAMSATIGIAHAAPGLGILIPGMIMWTSGSSTIEQPKTLRVGMGGAQLVF